MPARRGRGRRRTAGSRGAGIGVVGNHRGRGPHVLSRQSPLGAPPESLFRMELAATSVSAIAYFGDGSASVRWLNDTSHLR
ncbi:acid phosphatase [Nocardia seriolae]|nr:acid phosphatase [Nocardia seriolae]